ncbi:unnamed protein product [Trichobilharzia szidati]|nr:unnamed protein product [Trichobilharzia szidati]
MSRFTKTIDIIARFKHLKSPNIPFCVKACCDELLERVKIGQLRVLPNSITSLFSSASEARKVEFTKIEETLEVLMMHKKPGTVSEDNNYRIYGCGQLPTHMVFAVLWEFLQRSQDTLAISLVYPTNGWTILGPPYFNDFEVIDDTRYFKDVSHMLTTVQHKLALRKDIFCYIMMFLMTMIENAVENHRDKPSIGTLVRYQLAYLFGPLLLTLKCDTCDSHFEATSNTCTVCCIITDLLQAPYIVDIMDRLLRYVPKEYWNNALINPRSIISTAQEPEQLHEEIVNHFHRSVQFQSTTLPDTVRYLFRSSSVNQSVLTSKRKTVTDSEIAPKEEKSTLDKPQLFTSVDESEVHIDEMKSRAKSDKLKTIDEHPVVSKRRNKSEPGSKKMKQSLNKGGRMVRSTSTRRRSSVRISGGGSKKQTHEVKSKNKPNKKTKGKRKRPRSSYKAKTDSRVTY